MSLIMDNTSYLSCIPYNSVDWFQYWPSYLSFIATLILDVCAILFSYYAFVSEKISSKEGTISIDQICISNIKMNYASQKLFFDIELIDNSPLLSYYHQVKIDKLNIYICTSTDTFMNDDVFESDFTINSNYTKDILPVYCIDNLEDSLTPIVSSEKLIIDLGRRTISDFDKFLTQTNEISEVLNYILTNKLKLSEDQKMLLIEFSYVIIDENNYFKNKRLNDTYKKIIQERRIKQYNRIWLKLSEEEQVMENSDVFIYKTCSNVRKILDK